MTTQFHFVFSLKKNVTIFRWIKAHAEKNIIKENKTNNNQYSYEYKNELIHCCVCIM